MKKLIRSRNVSIVGKLCALMLALAVVCVSAPSYAALIESNGTGKYEIMGNDTWGLIGPPTDEEVSSLIIYDGATLKLLWNDDYPSSPISLGMIYGNGDMDISGGGNILGEFNISTPGAVPNYMVSGLNSISDINIDADGLFSFNKLSDSNDYYRSTQDVNMTGGSMTVSNVRFTPDSDVTPSYQYSNGTGLNTDRTGRVAVINGDVNITIDNSDVSSIGWGGFVATKVVLNGNSTMSITNADVKSSSQANGVQGANLYALGGWSASIHPTNTYKDNSVFIQNGRSNIILENISFKSEQSGWISIFAGSNSTGTADGYKASAEIASSYIEINNITFDVSEKPIVHIVGGGQSRTYIDNDGDGTMTQFNGSAESHIKGLSEILLVGNGVFSGIANGGTVYCGGDIIGDNANSTVGSAKLTLKDISSEAQSFSGILSGQGAKHEYTDDKVGSQVIVDYTGSVLGDSVLVLDTVKADMSSDTDKVTVKYFDEIQLANNTAVKLTTLDGDVKKLTVTGAWGAEVTALEFKQPVQNFASIAVDYSTASGVTDAYFTDDGMKFIVNGTGGTTPEEPAEPEQPSTGGGSGGGGGGCNAGFGFGGLLALAGLAVILRKNGGR